MLEELDEFDIPPEEIVIEARVGTGCTAEVFKGFWTRIRKVVAIKQIHTAGEAKLVSMRELSVLKKVHHENLVDLFGVCVSPTSEFSLRLITEFCEGGACFELLHNCLEIELVFRQQVKMCLDVSRAMRYLHTFEPMIIHRDLKSLNLLLTTPITGPDDFPTVKVCDFGVAKLKEDDSAEWSEMTVQAGTMHWMAPEMWKDTTYTEKVDVFSYAMVVYEIICREVPFEEEEPSDVGNFTMAGIRPDMDAIPPNTPPEIVKLMQECWQQEPDARPSFTEVVPQLESLFEKV